MNIVECAGGIVVSRQQRILVVTNQLGRLTLPKGRCERRESLDEAALREIREEAGLEAEIIKELGFFERPGFTDTNTTTPSVWKRIHMFHCVTKQLELGPFAPDIITAQWVSPGEVGDVLSWPEEIAFFNQHQAKLGLNTI